MNKKWIGLIALFLLPALAAQAPSANPQERLEAGIYSDNAAEIKAAVKAGANPNGVSYGGHFLGIAATRGLGKAVRALVESGANVNQSGSGGWTAVRAAADNGHLEIL